MLSVAVVFHERTPLLHFLLPIDSWTLSVSLIVWGVGANHIAQKKHAAIPK